jgi:hypothetical protein
MERPSEQSQWTQPGPERDQGRRVLAAVVIVLLVLLAFFGARRLIKGPDRFTIEQTRPLTSQVDGLRYRVHEGHAGSQRAADTLATLNARVIDLLRSLRARYARGPAGAAHPARREAVARLLARYNPDHLAENSPENPLGESSYVEGKGNVVALCLRTRGSAGDEDGIHDLSILFFVTLHEMGHVATDEIGHPPRFWSTFRFLLEEAELAGLYASPDFAAMPAEYCGVRVDFNPRWDSSTPSI